jgi:hypothetical protein
MSNPIHPKHLHRKLAQQRLSPEKKLKRLIEQMLKKK